jgi:hypothetical protein
MRHSIPNTVVLGEGMSKYQIHPLLWPPCHSMQLVLPRVAAARSGGTTEVLALRACVGTVARHRIACEVLRSGNLSGSERGSVAHSLLHRAA